MSSFLITGSIKSSHRRLVIPSVISHSSLKSRDMRQNDGIVAKLAANMPKLSQRRRASVCTNYLASISVQRAHFPQTARAICTCTKCSLDRVRRRIKQYSQNTRVLIAPQHIRRSRGIKFNFKQHKHLTQRGTGAAKLCFWTPKARASPTDLAFTYTYGGFFSWWGSESRIALSESESPRQAGAFLRSLLWGSSLAVWHLIPSKGQVRCVWGGIFWKWTKCALDSTAVWHFWWLTSAKKLECENKTLKSI